MATAHENRDIRQCDAVMPQADRRAWAVPVGLGAGLLGVGGFFVLIAHGLSVLASIG